MTTTMTTTAGSEPRSSAASCSAAAARRRRLGRRRLRWRRRRRVRRRRWRRLRRRRSEWRLVSPALEGRPSAIDEAVREAETKTGLQFCVYLGPAGEDTRAHAERAFVEAGLHERPAVLVLVAPDANASRSSPRPTRGSASPTRSAKRRSREMTPYFARNDFVAGLVVGIGELAERTGPGTANRALPICRTSSTKPRPTPGSARRRSRSATRATRARGRPRGYARSRSPRSRSAASRPSRT